MEHVPSQNAWRNNGQWQSFHFIHTAGKYDVEILYTCPLDSAGSIIELSHLAGKLTGKVTPGWDPPLYTNQDTISRPPAESKMKEFKTLHLGTIELKPGRGPLTLRATEIPGGEVMHLRALTLTLTGLDR